MVLGVVGSSPTSHPIMIAVIDGQPVGCRNSCFPSIQIPPVPVRWICNPAQFCLTFRRIANHGGTSKSAAPEHQSQPCRNTEACRGESACRQYRVARWFLLPEVELAAAAGSGQRIANMAWRSSGNLGRSIAFIEMFDYEPLAKVQCPQVPAIWST